MIKFIKNFTTIVFITIIFFLAFDLTLSRLGFNVDYLLNNKRWNSEIKGIAHPIYHHDLKNNLNMTDIWGQIKYKLCTNEFGFKVSCNHGQEKRKDFDIAFIGDSFTESVGITYEDSFVGLYAQKHPDITVANLGVSSYSPIIYWKKIEFLLNNGFTFKHIVVMPDISDIQDEALYYELDEKNGVVVGNIEHGTARINKVTNSFHRILMNNFTYTWYINCKLYDYFRDESEDNKRKDAVDKWTRDIDSPYFGKGGVLDGIQKSLKYTHKLKQLLDKHNIKISIIVYPWPGQLLFEDESHLGVQIWKDFCMQENCYNFIDLNKVLFGEIQKTSKLEVIKKYYIHGDVHFNEEGNKIMFETINTHLKPR
jgi:hypothetical protein